MSEPSLRPIEDIAAQLGIDASRLERYGKHIAKLPLDLLEPGARAPGKMILVTGITPTSHGEGKTVTAIGLTQGLVKIGKRAVATLREPSLGPVFGLKGGATGGGQSQVQPAAQINLHFTGDFHAITSAHNLLAAMLDAHLFHGNELGLDVNSVAWPRTMDMNDRALRRIRVGLGGKTNGVERDSGFVITAASEVMAILTLANSRADLRRRLENIVVGFTAAGQPVRAADLRAVGGMMALLHEAVAPNLVQTTEGAPAIVHCGPFANIAHGTSSVIAQRIGLHTADYAVNETGFAADLGAEKYFDIVMGSSGIRPAAAVLIASVRALAAQGSGDEKAPVAIPALRLGLANLGKHLENLAKFGAPVVVAINKFHADTGEQIAVIRDFCRDRGVRAEESDVFARGGEGGRALAEAVVEAAGRASDPRALYTPELPLRQKVERLAAEIYGAGAVEFTPEASAKFERFTALGYGAFPICMAKTQNSISDNPKLYGAPSGYTLRVTDAHLSAGAGFVVAIAGNMMRMPGLGKAPQAVRVDVTESGQVQL